MADTFSNDLRLRLQESGSNAGTWGDLLNGTITNIASALGQGSEAIPNASTHTITLADGTADEARSLYLKCTGGGQACTVTLGPNTISKVWIIDNATSYTLTFSQGSGANVAIAAGAVKVIATDGAGSGAAVVDTLDGLEGSLSTLAVTGTATMGGVEVSNTDDIRIRLLNGATFKAGIQVATTAGDMIAGSAVDDLAIRAQTNMLFSTGGNTERMRIDGATGNVGINSVPDSWSALTSLDISQSASFAGHDSQNGAYFMNNLYFNGSAWTAKNTGTSSGIVLDNISVDGMQFFENASASADAGVSLVERMRLDSSGNLSLGGNPLGAARLGVSKSSGGDVFIVTDTTSADLIVNCTSGVTRVSPSTGTLALGTGNVEKMRINAGGQLLINTTTGVATGTLATSGLEIVAPSGQDAIATQVLGGATCFGGSGPTTSSQTYLFGQMINSSGSTVGSIVVSASATAYNTSSDYRLKENVVAISNATERLKQLNPSRFNFIEVPDKTVDGFLAHEVADVVPEAISGTKDAVDADGNPAYQGIDQSKLVPLLVATIQELEARLTTLENKQ